MRFSILGPLRINDDPAELTVSAPRQRAMLALFLIHANEVVSTDRILDEVWGADRPASGVKTLHYHISKLREALGSEARLTTRPPGYVLEVEPEELDSFEFAALAEEGNERLDSNPRQADVVLKKALALWHGDPLSEFTYSEFAQHEIGRLNELHRAVLADRIEAALDLGGATELIGGLEELVDAHPFDERFRGQLMIALYRSGRQADALEAYREARELLGEELGIEPSAALQALEERILLQDPELASSEQAVVVGLPSYLTDFVGRGRELETVHRLLDGSRLVTVTGLGGIGKTRVAVEAARQRAGRYRHGASMVDLATATDELGVLRAFSDALNMPADTTSDLEEAVTGFLRRKELLVVVDNCEQVVESLAAPLESFLRAAGALTVLATSREPIGVGGEVTYLLPPLSLEDPGGDGAGSDALALFVDRARMRRADLEPDDDFEQAARRICQRLDGLPLAIELAAARLRMLPIDELERRLDERFAILKGGDRTAPERHHALDVTLDWSYGHLDPAEQDLFAALAVFRGGFDLQAAERCAVVADDRTVLDLLGRLCDTSLVVPPGGGSRRYQLLETIREYALMKLEALGPDDAFRRHAAYFADVVERAAEEAMSDRQAAFRRLAADSSNIHAALNWALDADGDTALRIAAGMGEYWFDRRSHEAARRDLSAAIDRAGDSDEMVLLRALKHLALLAVWMGDGDEADRLIARQREIMQATAPDPALAESLASHAQSVVAWSRGNFRLARQYLVDAIEIAATAETPELQASVAGWTATVAFLSAWVGDIDTAEEYAGRLENLRSPSNAALVDALLADARGTISWQQGDPESAAGWFRSARSLYEGLDMGPNVEDMLQSEATVLLAIGQVDEAEPLIGRALELARTLDDRRLRIRGVLLQGRVALARGDQTEARHRLTAALRMSHRAGDRAGVAWALMALASLAAAIGDHEQVIRLHSLAEAIIAGELEIPAAHKRHAEEELASASAALSESQALEPAAAGYEEAWAVVGDELLEPVSAASRRSITGSASAGDAAGT